MSCEKLKKIQYELKAILDNKNSTNQDFKNFYDRWGIKYSYKLETNIKDSCTDLGGYYAENTAEIPQECVDNTRKLCLKIDPEGKGSWNYDECMRKYAPYLKNIYQSNINIRSNECLINTILGDPELAANQNLGVVVGMILAERTINCNSRDINNYNDTFETDEKIKIINECFNSSIVEQKNYLTGCRLANKTQININENVNKCLITTNLAATKPPTVTSQPPNTTIIPTIPTTMIPTTTNMVQTTRQLIKPQTTISPTTQSPTTTQSSTNNLILVTIVVFISFIIIILVILKFKKII
jgi:hypothetical protein